MTKQLIYIEWFNINVGAPPPSGLEESLRPPGLIGLNEDFIVKANFRN